VVRSLLAGLRVRDGLQPRPGREHRVGLEGADPAGLGDVSGTGAGHLVDAPANDVEVVGNRLVVATDVGVYVSGMSGGTWSRVGSGMPNVITVDLSVTSDGRLLAATHGRGLWVIPLDGLS